jgi:hypothetical protein
MSQSAKPALQRRPQVPIVQVGSLLGRLGQALPQAPQWATLLVVLDSQPLPASLSQLAKPALQAPTAQAPIVHAAVPLLAIHVVPQAPQLLVLACTSTHPPPQQRSPMAQRESSVQPATHWLPMHR